MTDQQEVHEEIIVPHHMQMTYGETGDSSMMGEESSNMMTGGGSSMSMGGGRSHMSMTGGSSHMSGGGSSSMRMGGRDSDMFMNEGSSSMRMGGRSNTAFRPEGLLNSDYLTNRKSLFDESTSGGHNFHSSESSHMSMGGRNSNMSMGEGDISFDHDGDLDRENSGRFSNYYTTGGKQFDDYGTFIERASDALSMRASDALSFNRHQGSISLGSHTTSSSLASGTGGKTTDLSRVMTMRAQNEKADRERKEKAALMLKKSKKMGAKTYMGDMLMDKIDLNFNDLDDMNGSHSTSQNSSSYTSSNPTTIGADGHSRSYGHNYSENSNSINGVGTTHGKSETFDTHGQGSSQSWSKSFGADGDNEHTEHGSDFSSTNYGDMDHGSSGAAHPFGDGYHTNTIDLHRNHDYGTGHVSNQYGSDGISISHGNTDNGSRTKDDHYSDDESGHDKRHHKHGFSFKHAIPGSIKSRVNSMRKHRKEDDAERKRLAEEMVREGKIDGNTTHFGSFLMDKTGADTNTHRSSFTSVSTKRGIPLGDKLLDSLNYRTHGTDENHGTHRTHDIHGNNGTYDTHGTHETHRTYGTHDDDKKSDNESTHDINRHETNNYASDDGNNRGTDGHGFNRWGSEKRKFDLDKPIGHDDPNEINNHSSFYTSDSHTFGDGNDYKTYGSSSHESTTTINGVTKSHGREETFSSDGPNSKVNWSIDEHGNRVETGDQSELGDTYEYSFRNTQMKPKDHGHEDKDPSYKSHDSHEKERNEALDIRESQYNMKSEDDPHDKDVFGTLSRLNKRNDKKAEFTSESTTSRSTQGNDDNPNDPYSSTRTGTDISSYMSKAETKYDVDLAERRPSDFRTEPMFDKPGYDGHYVSSTKKDKPNYDSVSLKTNVTDLTEAQARLLMKRNKEFEDRETEEMIKRLARKSEAKPYEIHRKTTIIERPIFTGSSLHDKVASNMGKTTNTSSSTSSSTKTSDGRTTSQYTAPEIYPLRDIDTKLVVDYEDYGAKPKKREEKPFKPVPISRKSYTKFEPFETSKHTQKKKIVFGENIIHEIQDDDVPEPERKSKPLVPDNPYVMPKPDYKPTEPKKPNPLHDAVGRAEHFKSANNPRPRGYTETTITEVHKRKGGTSPGSSSTSTSESAAKGRTADNKRPKYTPDDIRQKNVPGGPNQPNWQNPQGFQSLQPGQYRSGGMFIPGSQHAMRISLLGGAGGTGGAGGGFVYKGVSGKLDGSDDYKLCYKYGNTISTGSPPDGFSEEFEYGYIDGDSWVSINPSHAFEAYTWNGTRYVGRIPMDRKGSAQIGYLFLNKFYDGAFPGSPVKGYYYRGVWTVGKAPNGISDYDVGFWNGTEWIVGRSEEDDFKLCYKTPNKKIEWGVPPPGYAGGYYQYGQFQHIDPRSVTHGYIYNGEYYIGQITDAILAEMNANNDKMEDAITPGFMFNGLWFDGVHTGHPMVGYMVNGKWIAGNPPPGATQIGHWDGNQWIQGTPPKVPNASAPRNQSVIVDSYGNKFKHLPNSKKSTQSFQYTDPRGKKLNIKFDSNNLTSSEKKLYRTIDRRDKRKYHEFMIAVAMKKKNKKKGDILMRKWKNTYIGNRSNPKRKSTNYKKAYTTRSKRGSRSSKRRSKDPRQRSTHKRR